MRTRRQYNKDTTWNRCMLGKESLWYFGNEKSRAISFIAREYFSIDPEVPFDDNIVFVSLKTVLGLGSSVLCEQNNEDYDNAANDKKDKVYAWNDEELLNEAPTGWKLSDEKRTKGVEIAVRLSNGNTIKLPIRVKTFAKALDNWTTYVRRVLSLGSGSSFKPTRQCDMPLVWPLLVKPLEKRQNLVHPRSYQDLNSFFRGLINDANTANDRSKMTTGNGNIDDGKWKLMLYDDSPSNCAHQYKKMSDADPFELYSTWIHEDDWHSYMTMLAETKTNPIRKFISLNNADVHKTLDNLLFKVGLRDLNIQGSLSPEERKEHELDPSQAKFDKDAVEELNRRRVTKAVRQRRLQGIKSQNKTYRFANGQATIETGLSVAKMDAACGKRPSQPTQAAVMGDFSAGDIARGLGWEESRLASGFYSSEWLHLSAFSFGGFLPAGAKSGFSTSQNLENLIFGTSETNSLMTRYEMAWQNLYREEQEIENREAKAQGRRPRSLEGQLSIHCNNFSKPIRYDFYGLDNKYKFEDFTIPQHSVNKAVQIALDNQGSDNPQLMCAAYASNNDTAQLGQDSPEPEEAAFIDGMLALAHDFSFVVYSMEYKIQNNFWSSILKEDKTTASFTFYPFQRSLYHQAEAVLDALVWKKLKDKAGSFFEADFGEEDTKSISKNHSESIDEENAMVSIAVNAMATTEGDVESICEEDTESIYMENAKVTIEVDGMEIIEEGNAMAVVEDDSDLLKGRHEVIKDRSRLRRMDDIHSDYKKKYFKVIKDQVSSQQRGKGSSFLHWNQQ